MVTNFRTLVAVASVGSAIVACGSESPSAGRSASPPHTTSPGPTTQSANDDLNELGILASVANGSYKYSPQFTPVNRGEYDSTAASGAKINVWVTSADFGDYSRIAPEKSGSHVTLRPGAMIVREVLKDGNPVKLTLMVKGPPGYNPALGDFWFGVTEPNGAPLEESGAKLTGKLSQCYACHIPRESDGFLFGVPEDVRGGGAEPDASTSVDAGTVAEPPPPPPPPRDVCGDFYCSIGESCKTCPSDCGPCPPANPCGDGHCAANESCQTCPVDCGACAGDDDDTRR